MRIGQRSIKNGNDTRVATHVYAVIMHALGSVFSALNLTTAFVTSGIASSEYSITPP